MISAPIGVIIALDRLNGHARAHGCGKRAIYAYKRLAVTAAALSGQVACRPVAVITKCHRCDGTGFFYDWYEGKTNRPCRSCGKRGHVRLRFAETQFGGFTWHHPWVNDGGCEIFRIARGLESCGWCLGEAGYDAIETVSRDGTMAIIEFEGPGDWKPNQGGTKLDAEEAAKFLNVVEEWVEFLDAYRSQSDLDWLVRSAQREMRGYTLYIGRTSTSCHYCGNAEVYSGQHHICAPLEWSTPTCKQHSNIPVADWDNEVPPSAITPTIQQWLIRHQVQKVGVTA